MQIFFMLNGLGLVFLLYVLVNFWKEGKRTKSTGGHHTTDAKDWRDFRAMIVTHPISHSAQGGISVVPLRLSVQRSAETPAFSPDARQVIEMPLNRISTGSAAEGLPHRSKIAAKDGLRC